MRRALGTLDETASTQWLQTHLLRCDCAFGTDHLMREAEAEGLPYLFTLKQSKRVKRLIEKLFAEPVWEAAGQGWQGIDTTLQLQGWDQARRVVVLRRRLKEPLLLKGTERATGQQVCDFVDSVEPRRVYEYVVLGTTLPEELGTLAQHYRDRADMENVFDELKNQWGWGGYTTKDLQRCQLMARQIALIDNWWSIIVRLAIPRRHAEAITSRPLLLMAGGTQTRHQGQTTLRLTSTHAKTGQIQPGFSSRIFMW